MLFCINPYPASDDKYWLHNSHYISSLSVNISKRPQNTHEMYPVFFKIYPKRRVVKTLLNAPGRTKKASFTVRLF